MEQIEIFNTVFGPIALISLIISVIGNIYGLCTVGYPKDQSLSKAVVRIAYIVMVVSLVAGAIVVLAG